MCYTEKEMRRAVAIFIFLLSVGVLAWLFFRPSAPVVSPLGKIFEKPLDKYTLERLSQRPYSGSQIVFAEAVATTSSYTTYRFYFTSDEKKITGLAHIPQGPQPVGGFPVIMQLRGYVDREKYTPGEGTKRSAQVFASNGFVSLAPDFLGYGGSASPSSDIFEERFQTYTTVLNLIASIKTLPMANAAKIGLWGHSNGGQIALTALEVLKQPIPTVLWAPVSKPFPYSILYYTDEASDRGKLLRRRLAKFEEDYDVELYSMPNYFDWISAPLLIQQGTTDSAVPQRWSDELVKLLKEKGKQVTYFIYPGADHNLQPAWNTVVTRDLEFFRRHLYN
ncbi:MAG: alpha/beta hydrolase family protein [Patescibacteria group bacterium]